MIPAEASLAIKSHAPKHVAIGGNGDFSYSPRSWRWPCGIQRGDTRCRVRISVPGGIERLSIFIDYLACTLTRTLRTLERNVAIITSVLRADLTSEMAYVIFMQELPYSSCHFGRSRDGQTVILPTGMVRGASSVRHADGLYISGLDRNP